MLNRLLKQLFIVFGILSITTIISILQFIVIKTVFGIEPFAVITSTLSYLVGLFICIVHVIDNM